MYVPLHVNQFSGMLADIPPDIEVRWSKSRDLVIRQKDKDDRFYYLVTGDPPDMKVEGWIKGEDGKQEWWLEDRGGRGKPAFFIPIDALNNNLERNEI